MSESTLTLGYDELRSEIAHFLGYGRSSSGWSTKQIEDIDFALHEGTRQFCYPILPQGQRHDWSFLKPLTNLDITAGTSKYTLPDNYGGQCREFWYTIGDRRLKVAVISESQFYSVRSIANQDGEPKYAIIRPIASTGIAGQRWEVLFYPTPNRAMTLNYAYAIIPERLSANNPFPLGSAIHASTLLESCLAAAEFRALDVRDVHWALYQEHLASSIQRDKEMSLESPDFWVSVGGEDLSLEYIDLAAESGKILGFGYEPSSWNHTQERIVDATVQEGLRQFYFPPVFKEGDAPHLWSFLRLPNDITTTTAAIYDLPQGFHGIYGKITYVDSVQRDVELVQDDEIRSLRANASLSGAPKYAAIRAKENGGGYEIVFYPTPDATYKLRFQYCPQPPRLTLANPVPMGASKHSQMILASCQAAAENRKEGKQGERYSYFLKLVEAAIAADRKTVGSSIDSAWPVSQTLPTDTTLTYNDFSREIGGYMGYGWDEAAWSHRERQHVDSLIQRGLGMFQKPPVVGNQSKPHHWSFMNPIATLFTVKLQEKYDLPVDFAGFAERFGYDYDVIYEYLSRIWTDTADVLGTYLTDEIIQVPDFSSATGWTLGAGWSIAGGKAVKIAHATTVGSLTYASTNAQNISRHGGLYKVQYTIDAITEGLRCFSDGRYNPFSPSADTQSPWVGALRTAAGTYTEILIGRCYPVFQPKSKDTTCTLDNVSMKEIGNYEDIAILGDELLSDTDFSLSSNTKWTLGTGWTYDTANNRISKAVGVESDLRQGVDYQAKPIGKVLPKNKVYFYEIEAVQTVEDVNDDLTLKIGPGDATSGTLPVQATLLPYRGFDWETWTTYGATTTGRYTGFIALAGDATALSVYLTATANWGGYLTKFSMKEVLGWRTEAVAL